MVVVRLHLSSSLKEAVGYFPDEFPKTKKRNDKMDYLKELARRTGGKIRVQDLFSSNFNQKSFRVLVIQDFKQYKVQIHDVGTLCSIEIKVDTEIAFAINNPDKVLFLKAPIRPKSFPYTIYASETKDILENEEFEKAYKALGDLLEKISIAPEESVFVAGNVIGFALKTSRDLLSVLDDIVDLLERNQDIFKRTVRKIINIKEIPERLRILAPLLKKYSIPDDAEREQLIESLSKKKKMQLIESVDPYMSEINNYLSSFEQQPLSEEATLIGNLAELVTELKINSIS